MENLSHSHSKKISSSNGFAGKTVYDDVFGGPPKFGVPTLSPRVEDYREIFESFHASRASSIPILDLPAVDGADDLSFDVRSSMLDYSEVFGGFDGLDFAVPYEELFKKSNGGDDSSDEQWTPAQSESLSDESDLSACSEKDQSLSNEDPHLAFDGTKQFNISYHKANPKGKEDISNGMTCVTHLQAVPGFTLMVNETPPPRKIEQENPSLEVTNDLNLSMDFGGGITEGKRLRKTMSQPSNSNFVSLSNISLRTQPSQLPPPSRPPPALAVKKGDSGGQNAKLRASKSYDFKRKSGESSPPYFDVEIDASSSAAVSAAAMKDAVEKAQAKLRSAKELMERKKEGQSRTKLRLEGHIKNKGGNVSETFDRSSSFKDERVKGTCEKEVSATKPYAGEEREKLMKKAQVFSGSIEGEKYKNAAGKSAEGNRGMEHKSSHGSHKTEGTVDWREETQFYEVVGIEQVKDEKTLVQNTKSHECGQEKKAAVEAFEQQEYDGKIKAVRDARECEENGNQLEVAKGAREWDENKGRRIATKEVHGQEEHREKANAAQRVFEWKENEIILGVVQQHGEVEKTLNEADKGKEIQNHIENQLKDNQVEDKQKLKEAYGKIENEKRFKDAHESKESDRGSKGTFERQDYEREYKEAVQWAENEKRVKERLELEAKEKQQQETRKKQENEKKKKEAREGRENEKKQKEARERGEKEKRLKEALKQEGNEKRSKEVFEQGDSDHRLKMDILQEDNKKEQKLAYEREQNEERLRGALNQERNHKNLIEAMEQKENATKQKKAYEGDENEKRLNDACEREENEKRLKEVWEQEENKKRLQEAHEIGECEKRAQVVFQEEGIEKRSKEASERDETVNRVEDAGNWEGFTGENKDHEQTEKEENEWKLNSNQELHVHTTGLNSKASNGASKLDDEETPNATQVAGEHGKNGEKLETIQDTLSCEEDGKLGTKPKGCERELEVVEGVNILVEARCDSSGMDQNDLHHEKTKIRMEDVTKSRHLSDSVATSNEAFIDIRQTHVENDKRASEMASDPENATVQTHKRGERAKNIKGVQFAFDQEGSKDKKASELASDPENATVQTHKWGERAKNIKGVQFAFDHEGSKDKFMSPQVVVEWVEHGRKMGDAPLPAVLEVKGKSQNTVQKVTGQSLERKEKNSKDTLAAEEREKEERLKRERELENDRLRKIEEEREREREREKDRMAVDRATCEARERAFAEARERAERAAVERATAEFRQRAMAEARERLEKASAEARERSFTEKASTEARLRSERAAVEKATLEARERAVEKALAERSISDKFSVSSRNGGVRQNPPSSDLQFQGVGSSSGSRYIHSSVHGGEGESPQRCKARLERHQRTSERAAKALAEKNMRDLLTQREQAERNRLAESLDAEVKRWSSGKEGNLRALLSTLQYILGPDSGWQSIPLTDVITAVAVKKAYRKATLCVHPDKLQQRGASIQQKYVCEKVFDLLKEAWNKFNSEER